MSVRRPEHPSTEGPSSEAPSTVETHPRARRPRRLLRLIRAIAAGGAAFVLSACLSPTLPLPPPELPQNLHDRGDGVWSVQGNCLVGAEVTVLNEATGLGAVIIDRDQNGAYYVELAASPCDVITISQTLGAEDSGSTSFVLQSVSDGLPDDPSACKL
jgi:hypothetical protein